MVFVMFVGERNSINVMMTNQKQLKKRIEVNEEQTNALVDFYQEKGILRIIDGQQAPDDVFADIQQILD